MSSALTRPSPIVVWKQGDEAASWVISTFLMVAVSATAGLLVDPLWHWLLLPVTVSGILIGVDAVSWVRKRLDLFSPQALVGIFGVHFFYIAPVLSVAWGFWPKYVPPAQDWRASVGVLASVNVLGLLLYRLVLTRRRGEPPRRRQLVVDERTFHTFAQLAVLVSLSMFVVVVLRLGGPSGYLERANAETEALAGMGYLFLLAEAWPLMLFAMLVLKHRKHLRDHRLQLALLILIFVGVQFVVGGLRGSRSNTVWPTLIAIGMVHLLVVRIRRRTLVAGALVMVGFMWLYGFYKAVGTESFNILTGQASVTTLSDQTGRNFQFLLLEDFGRVGTQALVVDRIEHGTELAKGETYLGDATLLVPSWLVPEPPRGKVEVGSDALYGMGSFDGGVRSTRIYGLTGEAMLNGGVLAGALVMGLFGFYVRFANSLYHRARSAGTLDRGLVGAAHFMAPAIGISAVLVLGNDFDNLIWFFAKQILPLATVVWLARKPSSVSAKA